MNVVLQLLNDEFLILDDAFYQIADRYDADHFVSFEHREMTHAPVRHEGHAFLDGLFGPRTCDLTECYVSLAKIKMTRITFSLGPRRCLDMYRLGSILKYRIGSGAPIGTRQRKKW